MQPSEELLTPGGPVATTRVELDDIGDWLVWELTVEDHHNFTVMAGDNAVLVHNCAEIRDNGDDTFDVGMQGPTTAPLILEERRSGPDRKRP